MFNKRKHVQINFNKSRQSTTTNTTITALARSDTNNQSRASPSSVIGTRNTLALTPDEFTIDKTHDENDAASASSIDKEIEDDGIEENNRAQELRAEHDRRCDL